MVRVCLYLALALGLAGSAEAACAQTGLSAANGFAAGTAGTGGYTAGNPGKNCPTDITSVATSEACSIKCKPGYFITSNVRRAGEEAWLYCDDADASAAPTCTACTAVEDMTVNAAEPTCTSATNSEVTSCLTGFYHDTTGDAHVCTAWKSQENCDVDTADTNYLTGKFLACTTAKAGYKVTAGKVEDCVTDEYFGMNAFNSADEPSKATGITCKNDGTVIRIPSCPAGTFKTAGTATTSDTCTACLDTGKSRCHCTGATAALCLATGSCASGYTGYEGDGAGKASKSTGCKACKACTATSTASKVAQWTSADCTTSSDYGCTDCPAVATNGKKAGASCYNAAFTNNVCVTNFDQKPGARASEGTSSNKLGCGKSTCVCPEGSSTGGTATAPTCTDWPAYANNFYQTTAGSATVKRVLAACPTTGTGYQAACATAGQFKTLGATAGTDESGDSCTATLDHKCTTCTTCSATSGIITAESTTGWASACVLDSGTANAGAGSDTVCSMPKLDHTWTAYEAIARTYKIYGASATANPVTTSGEVIVTTDAACTVTNAVAGSAGTEADIASSGTAQTTSAAESPAVTTSIAITNAATVYLCMRAAVSTVDANYFKVGTITVVAIGKSCLVQEWSNSHGGKCDVTNTGAQNGVSTPGGSTLEYLQPIRKSGYTAACTVTCDKTLGPFTVDTSTAVECTKQKGCSTLASGDCADDGNTDPNLKKWHTYRACTGVDAGYYLGEDSTDDSTSSGTGLYDVVKSCVGAGQSILAKDGKTKKSCSDACWYTAECKSGYTKTIGMGVSDTCVSDSAASVSLTAVLLSVVAKIFLF